MNSTILADNLSFRFGNETVVKEVSFTVSEGDIFGFVGPNGAGKTTTIKILLGLLTPGTGEVSIFGMSMRTHREQILKRIGSLVETPSLYPQLTASENLRLQQIAHRTSLNRITQVLELMGLEDAGNKIVKRFSLGMKQRLGIGMALLHNPQLLILDEPSNGLDPEGIHEFRKLLKRLSEEHGITVFLSSHILSELEQIVTKVGIINRGQICYHGSLNDLKMRNSGVLTLAVGNKLSAEGILQREGYKVELNDNQFISVHVEDLNQVMKLNSLLVQAGVGVHHLSFEQPNLEKIFLEIIHKHEGGVN